MSQSEGTWIKQAYFLCSGPCRGTEDSVTLICFGAHPALEQRFEYLRLHPSWIECVKSPLTLFVIVLDELFHVLDNQVWKLLDVFRTMEMVRILNS
jgi:hypothetical protein